MTDKEEELDDFYDPTDDAFEEDEDGVMSDEALFTDERMLAFAEEDRKERRRKLLDRCVTVTIILVLIAIAAGLISIFL